MPSYTYVPRSAETAELSAQTPWVVRFVGELGVFTGFVLLCGSTLALFSYSLTDAAWSGTGVGFVSDNWLGSAGAWFADILYFLFGFGGWLLLIFGFLRWGAACLRLLPRRKAINNTQVAPSLRAGAQLQKGLLRYIGLTLLLCATCALAWSRGYHFDAAFPAGAGGIVGSELGALLQLHLGFNGMAVLLVPILVWSASWAYGFSWDKLALVLGGQLEHLFLSIKTHNERVLDARLGQEAARARDTLMQAHLLEERSGQTPALVITPTPVITPPAHTTRDKQAHLFDDASNRELPPIALLDPKASQGQATITPKTLEMTSRLIETKLADFGVQVKVMLTSPGPVITRYEIEPAAGVKGAQIVNLAKDLARALSLVSVRVIETVPGKTCMALELPNIQRQTIGLSEILDSSIYEAAKSPLSVALGKDIVGNPVVADLARMPHCLVAGTTGSGKSVGINAMLLSLLFKAEAKNVRLLLIDPKMLEMSVYEGIPHLLAPVVTDMRQAANALNWCVAEMERRYKLLSTMGVRNITSFNQKIAQAQAHGTSIANPFSLTPEDPEALDSLPFIVIVIDELADLMMVVGKKIEELIARLAQKARAAGIHLVLATQRPSVDVITGLIKANIPTRISFQVSSKIDSRTILDQMGAEALLGMGDMLYMPNGAGLPTRVHGAFVSDDEVHRVVQYLRAQGEANYVEGILEGGSEESGTNGLSGQADSEQDPLYDQAVGIVLKHRKASISLVQRHLKIGYNRAARLLESMEQAGLVSSLSSSGQRDILVPENNA